jgi:hypothetical protein
MEAEDWLKGVEKKLMIAQCMDRKMVLFVVHQLFGTAANWWETYCNTHADVNSIMWNEFKAHFHNHYVPRGTMKLKKKEFTNLRQGSMTVNEYLNSFIQLSRYALSLNALVTAHILIVVTVSRVGLAFPLEGHFPTLSRDT